MLHVQVSCQGYIIDPCFHAGSLYCSYHFFRCPCPHTAFVKTANSGRVYTRSQTDPIWKWKLNWQDPNGRRIRNSLSTHSHLLYWSLHISIKISSTLFLHILQNPPKCSKKKATVNFAESYQIVLNTTKVIFFPFLLPSPPAWRGWQSYSLHFFSMACEADSSPILCPAIFQLKPVQIMVAQYFFSV